MVDRARPDQNNNFSLFAVSNADGVTPVSLWADPSTHLLQVSGGGSGGGGTQYVSGIATPGPLTGNALIYDNAGTLANVSIANPLPVAQSATNYIFSTGNNTTAQLASNATFTGTIESVQNQEAVSVDMTSDQPGTLILNQYIDAAGTYKISSWSFSIVANVPYSRSFVANGNYFNLTFKNTGASTTTTLNINTAYGTIPAATNLGNGPVSINEINGVTTPAGYLPASITNGTNTADVVAGDSGFNGVATASATKTYTFTTSTSGAQTLLPNTLTEGFSTITVVYTSLGVGLAGVSGQFAPNTGGTYITASTWINRNNSTGLPGVIGTTINTAYASPIVNNYFQLAITGLTSGTFSGYVVLSNTPITYHEVLSGQSGTWTVGSNSATGTTVPANAFFVGMQNASGNLTAVKSADLADGGSTGSSLIASGGYVYNGSTWDKMREATASGITGTGLAGAGNLGYDGTNWQAMASPLQTTTTSNTAQAMQLVGSGVQSNTFSVTSVSAGTTYDVGNFKSVSVQVTSQYTGTTPTITFQTSNDGTNWYSTPLMPAATLNGIATSSTTTTGIFTGSLLARYFRLNFTGAYVSGTAAGLIVFSATTISLPTVVNFGVPISSVPGAASTGSAVPTTASYMAFQNGSGNLTGVTTPASDGFASTPQFSTSIFNGANYDRTRSNTTGVVIAAGATTAQTSTTQTTYNASKLIVVINISAFTSGTLTFTINGITSSGYTYPILVSTALASTGVTPLRIFPGSTQSANAVANDMVPRSYNVVVTGTFSATYGVDYELSV